MRNRVFGFTLLAGAVAVAVIAVRHATAKPAQARPISELRRGQRYRFVAKVVPAFPDEASTDAQQFFALLMGPTTGVSVFGAPRAAAELEAIDNFPGQSRVQIVATAVRGQPIEVPETVFGFGGRELTITQVSEV